MTSQKKQPKEPKQNRQTFLFFIASLVITFFIFGSYAVKAVRQSCFEQTEASPEDFSRTTILGNAKARRANGRDQKLHQIALDDDHDFIYRARRRRKENPTLAQTVDRRFESIHQIYVKKRQRIEEGLTQTLREDPDAVIPEFHLEALEEQFKDGPQSF